ncbi:methyl-accepting chemotaxis protein [Chromatium okenii]|uniref:methyl-accepting chemotaxis protein n=1 Tax=Chromatium okenii TaxID=61644 RepID=UPI0026EC23F8|nr:methyl-accepting chemotaxis protein [Chromatium okenii]
MNPLNNMKISHRLYLITGIVIVSSLAIYLMLMLLLRGLEQTNMGVFDHEAKAHIFTQTITAELNMVSRLSRNIMLGGDFEKNLADIRAMETTIRTNFDALPAALTSAEEQRLAESSRKSTLEFISIVLSMVEDMRALPAAERHTLFERYERDATPPAQESRKYFGELTRLTELNYQSAAIHAKQQFDHLTTLLNFSIPLYIFVLSVILLSIAQSITKPLNQLIVAMTELSKGEGNLSQRLRITGRHELAQMAQVFNNFTQSIQHLIGQMHHHSSHAVSAAFHLEVDSEETLKHVGQAADQMAAVATASEQMTATTDAIAQSCSHAAEQAHEASKLAEQGAEVVQRTIATMQTMTQMVKSASEIVQDLGTRSDQIDAIVGAIKAIANQTNLLALNAAIEAARAGEQGRGFAVVATEVRALAERTNQATREISEMIQGIQQETTKAVISMSKSVTEAEQGSSEAIRSGDALADILSSANVVNLEIDQIATAAEQLAATNNEVANNILRISEVTQVSRDQSKRTEATVGGMMETFQALQASLGQFKNDDDLNCIIHKAKVAHLVFIRKIKQQLRTSALADPNALPTHHTCNFGKWYHGAGLECFPNSAPFREIDVHHKQVHELAKQALTAHNAEQHRQADQHYHAMVNASDRLQVLLDQLDR